MNSTLELPAAPVVEILRDYWALTDAHRKTLGQYRDADGDVKTEDLTDYDESRTTTALEASEFLDAAMIRLGEMAPLPDGLTMTVPGAFHTQYPVTTGRLDDAARDAFTSGQCHAMARALSEATGWPMFVLVDDECSYDPDDCGCEPVVEDVCTCQLAHVVVVRPDGFHVDISGAHAPGTVPGFEGRAAVAVNEGLWQFLDDGSLHWRRPAVAVARTFVKPLLDSLSPSA
ncbi:hypothetical protein [Streptomyces sp. NPDC004267]|uniref:hypothetical protein n=1 Tax=Streptomyces sp. NPDC004267 TaxID=3364694 RepID=UPI0036B7AC57